jgi:hypothetical protein
MVGSFRDPRLSDGFQNWETPRTQRPPRVGTFLTADEVAKDGRKDSPHPSRSVADLLEIEWLGFDHQLERDFVT